MSSSIEQAERYAAAVPGSPEGGRDNQTFELACKLVERFDIGDHDLLDVLLNWNNEKNSPPLDRRDIKDILKSARKRTEYDPSKDRYGRSRHLHRDDTPSVYPLPSEDDVRRFRRNLRSDVAVAIDTREYLEHIGIDIDDAEWGLAHVKRDDLSQVMLPSDVCGTRVVIPVRDPITADIVDVRRYAVGPLRHDCPDGLKMLPWAKGYGSPKPYRLQHEAGNHVIWTEGEKDCEILRSMGIPAVSNTSGCNSAATVAGKIPEEALPSEVTILFDRDKAGRDSALKLADVLFGRGVKTHIASWPDGPEDGLDVCDYMKDHTKDDIVAIIQAAKEVTVEEKHEDPDGLPVELAAERVVIGCVILGGTDKFAIADEILDADHFYDEKHRQIWKAFETLAYGGDPIDQVTISVRLRTMTKRDSITDEYLMQFVSIATDTSVFGKDDALRYHAEIVRKTGLTRNLTRLARAIPEQLIEPDKEPEAVVDEFLTSAARAIDTKRTRDHYHRENFLDTWLKKSITRGRRISTGMPELDRNLRGGWWSPHIHGLIARPKAGKSAMVATWISSAIADIVRHNKGCKVGVMSLEMPFEQEIARIMSIRTGIPFQQLELGPSDIIQLGSDEQRSALIDSLQEVESNSVVLDQRGITITQFRAKAQRMVEYDGCGIIFVENVNHIRAHGDSMVDRLTAAVEGVNDIAGILDIPIVGAMQLNREGAGENPTLDNVFGTDALARDCFWAGALSRKKTMSVMDIVEGSLNVVANRGGPEVKLKLRGDRDTMKWTEDGLAGEIVEEMGRTMTKTIYVKPEGAPSVVEEDDGQPWYANIS